VWGVPDSLRGHPVVVDRLALLILWLWREPAWGKPLLLVLALVVVVIFVIWLHAMDSIDQERLRRGRQEQTKALAPVPTKGYRPRGAVFIPFEIGGVTIDLQPRATETVHVLVAGTSRTGKSTSVLPLFDLPIGVLCIALDVSPIEEKVLSVGGKRWTNDPAECNFGLNLLGGASMFASEGLVAGFPKSEGNIGDWQRAAREVIWDGMDLMDSMGVERSIPAVVATLMQPMRDQELARVCRAWARKLQNLNRIMGATLGSDLDLVDAMRRGDKVICRLNRFLSPDDAPFIAGLLFVHGRRVMQEANVPFIFVVEEAGQAALAQSHMSPMAQAGAARGVALVAITQNASKLPIEVRNNFHVTVGFAQEDKHERDVIADRLELEADHLRRSAFPDNGVGWAYVRAPGVDTRLVHVRKYAPDRQAAGLSRKVVGNGHRNGERGNGHEPVVNGVWREVDGWQPWVPALGDGVKPKEVEPVPDWVAADLELVSMWERSERVGAPAILWSPSRGTWIDERGCKRWKGAYARQSGRPPRPRAGRRGRKDVTPYREFFQARHGFPAEPTYDHLCGHPWCVEVEHGEPCSIPENNARNTPRRLAFEAAGWQLVGDRWTTSGRVPAGTH
jgi:hypothetical protein